MSDQQLWDAFVSRSIASSDWTHRAHVRVAFLHLRRHSFSNSLALLRTRIQELNKVHGTPEAIDRGYHETVTQAFLRLIADAALRSVVRDSAGFCDENPTLLDKRVLLEFYSRERIMSAEAKERFVEPDIQPLPMPVD